MKNNIFVDPLTKENLDSIEGMFSNSRGKTYTLYNNIPNFIYPDELKGMDLSAQEFYNGRATQYDDTLHLTFYTHGIDEIETRNSFINNLNINENSKVLEIACGTGRDSELIAERLTGANAEFHLQDLSEDMMLKCYDKLKNFSLKKSFSLSNACYLPYPDNYFDATYSFGAVGEFSDKKQALAEMVRVTKPGGKVVFGDESIPEWYRKTDFYKILTKTNPMFAEEVPWSAFPVEARNTKVEWVIGGTFYLVTFEVGDGEPVANFDFEIPGSRGGTYRTRFEGELEGVSPEAKIMANKAIQKSGKSCYEWIDEAIKTAAEEELKK